MKDTAKHNFRMNFWVISGKHVPKAHTDKTFAMFNLNNYIYY